MIDKLRTGGGWIFVPYAKLMIAVDGELRELPEGMRDFIESYDLATEESGATTLEFTISDPEFNLINSSILFEDTAVYFECGWANDWNNIVKFYGYISVIDFEFTKNGYPSLTITCMDETHIMNRVERTRTFQNCKRSDIAKFIFDEYGIPSEVWDSGEKYDDVEEKITQSEETDIAFIQGLAGEVIGNIFICYIENGIGYFKPRMFKSPSLLDLYYRDENGNDISSFKCSVNKESIKFYKTASDVSIINGFTDTGIAYASSVDMYMQPDGQEASNSGEDYTSPYKIIPSPNVNTGSGETAQDKYNDVTYKVCEGSLKPVVAIPQLKTRVCINVLGVGSVLSGKYYIKDTQLTVDKSGISQTINLRKTTFKGTLRLTDNSRDGRPSPLIR